MGSSRVGQLGPLLLVCNICFGGCKVWVLLKDSGSQAFGSHHLLRCIKTIDA